MKKSRLIYFLINYFSLILIILIAVFFRFKNINFGLPFTYHPDEPYVVETIREMILYGDFNPHKFWWGSLLFYIQIPAFLLAYLSSFIKDGIKIFSAVPNSYFLLFGRILNASLGILSVYFLYRIGIISSGRITAVVSSTLFAISPFHIEHSKYLTPEAPLTFFLILSLYFAAKFYKDEKDKLISYCLAGLFMGFSISTKYNSIFFLVPLIALYFIKSKKINLFNKKFVLMLVLVFIAFALGSPFIFIDYKTSIKSDVGVLYNFGVYVLRGHPGTLGKNNLIEYSRLIKDNILGISGILFAAIGLFFSFKKKDYFLISIAGFSALYFIVLVIIKSYVERNMIILLPFLFLLIGYGFEEIMHNINKIKLLKLKNSILTAIVFLILLTALIFYPLKLSIAQDRELSKPDVRNRATVWVLNNITEDSKVAYQVYSPYLPNNIELVNEGLVPDISKNLNYYLENKFDFLILSSSTYERYINNPNIYPKESKYFTDLFNQLNEKQLLLKSFIRNDEEVGPEIYINWIPPKDFFDEQIPSMVERSILKLKQGYMTIKLDDLYQSDLMFLGFGWGKSEKDGTWMLGNTSTIIFYIDKIPSDKTIFNVFLEINSSNINTKKNITSISLNDNSPMLIEPYPTENSPKKVSYPINKIKQGLNKITFNIDIASKKVEIDSQLIIQEKKNSILFKKVNLTFE